LQRLINGWIITTSIMNEPSTDRSYHRAVIAAAIITAVAVVLGAFIQRPRGGYQFEQPSSEKSSPTTKTNEASAMTLSSLGTLTIGAEAGDRVSQSELADVYYEGRGVARNFSRAFYWYRQAASAGDARAEEQLGWMYTRGIGTTVDRAAAAHWFRVSAAKGDARAENYLGYAFVKGWGVPVDYSQARYWLSKSATANDRLGLYNLALMNENGLGAPPNMTSAISLYKRSASSGYDGARAALRRLGVSE
jgi:TPR repeat protein